MIQTYQVLFFTHTGAIRFDQTMKKTGINCLLMPVPRVLSSSCGVSARIEWGGPVELLISDLVAEIHRWDNDAYTPVYKAAD